VLACAFCIHPLAAIDFPMIQGIFEVYTSTFVMINKSGKEVNKIVDTIKKQVEKEGFQLRDFWGKCPPKTHQRCVELLTIAQRDNPEVKKIFESFKFTLNQVKELLIQGFKKLGTSCVVEMIVVNWSTHLAPLFLLDRQLANVSKWVASRSV